VDTSLRNPRGLPFTKSSPTHLRWRLLTLQRSRQASVDGSNSGIEHFIDIGLIACEAHVFEPYVGLDEAPCLRVSLSRLRCLCAATEVPAQLVTGGDKDT
jgi:hypothetical protein